MIQEFVPRSSENSLMEFCVPVLKCLHVQSIDRGGVGGGNFAKVVCTGVGSCERRSPGLKNLSYCHHINRTDSSEFLNNLQKIIATIMTQKSPPSDLARHRTIGRDLVDCAAQGIPRDFVLASENALVWQTSCIAPLS